MDIKEYYKKMSDSNLQQRITQYEEYEENGDLKVCDLRQDISIYAKNQNLQFSQVIFSVISAMLLEGAQRFNRILTFKLQKDKSKDKYICKQCYNKNPCVCFMDITPWGCPASGSPYWEEVKDSDI